MTFGAGRPVGRAWRGVAAAQERHRGKLTWSNSAGQACRPPGQPGLEHQVQAQLGRLHAGRAGRQWKNRLRFSWPVKRK
jgi:hypothetical protein